MSDEGGRRPRRAASKAAERTFQKASVTAQVPSAMHYVGYVEEDETPEMIMAKFAHLEQIQKEQDETKKAAAEAKAAAKAAAEADGEDADVAMDAEDDEANDEENPDFDEEMLLKVFKQTSNFSLKSAIKDDLYGDDHMLDRLEGGAARFYDDDDEGPGANEFWDEILGAAKKKRRVGGPKVPREPKAPKPQKSHMITAYNSDNQMLMRKKKIIDPRAPNILKLPAHPIPESWGKVIKPYEPPADIEAAKLALPDCTQHVMDIVKNCETLTDLGTDFLAVHANPPWAIDDSPDAGQVTVDAIRKIPFHKLAPYGFVFMWVEKENLSAVCDAMMDQRFIYVENMTWVQMMPNNTIAGAKARYPPTVPPHHAHVPPRRQAVPRGEGGGAQAPAHRGRHAGRAPDLIHRQARHPPARVQGYGDAPARGVQGWVQREAAGALVGTRRGGEAFGLDLGRRRQGQGEVICTIRIVRFL